MATTTTGDNNKKKPIQNPLERLKQAAPSKRKQTVDGIRGQALKRTEQLASIDQKRVKEYFSKQRTEFTVFRHTDYQEEYKVPRQIEQLIVEIRQEVEHIKKSNKSLVEEIDNIEKTTIQTLPMKSGIYHLRFLEIVAAYLKVLRSKIGEAHTWLEAMKTKKKKRGSLFVSLSKKKGTQYSLSQEIQTARGVM